MRGRGICASDDAAPICVTIRWMSVGPRSASASPGCSSTGRSHGMPEPNPRVSTCSSGRGGASEVQPPAYPVWNGVSRPGPDFDTARPGRAGSKYAAAVVPRTSSLSASSAIRRASRRLVLARRLSLMTPAGRCVARMRCRPSDRPRWATLTTPSTNSGTSCTRAANSSTTMTRLGGAATISSLT